MRRGRAAAFLAGVSMALGALLPGALHAQAAAPDEPTMPEAPEQFRVGFAVSGFDWEARDGLNAVEDVLVWSGEVETLVHRFLSFRFGVGFGQPDIRSPDDRASADQYMVELLGNLRFPVGAPGRLGMVPFVTGGYGSVVHAPEDRDDLFTRNQSTWVYGAGVEYNGLGQVGVRAEWRRARVAFGDLFSPENRDSTQRDVGRWILGVYWRF